MNHRDMAPQKRKRTASWWNRPILSMWPSPRPMMPPAQTEMPACRTLSIVFSLSSYFLDVVTFS